MNIYAAVPKMYKRIRYTVHAHMLPTPTHINLPMKEFFPINS